ncbi:hypothetical protein [Neptunomonas sp. XY-337]|uniref:hypothetical protein n=1 Tax=Neptunomonas sp. XY-337 TaxID=2561897 RepID=UPI0010AA37CD|nr:hypothetical protein [Neptunomonas sp. XY-337]
MKLTFFAIFTFISVNASASLVLQDWASTGDELLIHDTSTGFEWLDLSVTSNLSYDEILNDDQFKGFRHATRSEIETLFGAPLTEGGFAAILSSDALSRFDFIFDNMITAAWAPTSATHPTLPGIMGSPIPGQPRDVYRYAYTYNKNASSYNTLISELSASTATRSTGNYLLRSKSVNIPEPPVLWLLLTPLILGWVKRHVV